MPTPKQEVQDLLQELPDDVTLEKQGWPNQHLMMISQRLFAAVSTAQGR
jgi:hypothetical protein